MSSPAEDSLRRQIASIALAGAGLTLLAAAPAVSTAPWSRVGSSLDWAARLLRGR